MGKLVAVKIKTEHAYCIQTLTTITYFSNQLSSNLSIYHTNTTKSKQSSELQRNLCFVHALNIRRGQVSCYLTANTPGLFYFHLSVIQVYILQTTQQVHEMNNFIVNISYGFPF